MMPAATIRLMEALLASGPQGAHRESLISQTQMSTATFYRALEPLLKTNVLTDQGGHYRLPLSNPFNFAFKLWNDQERLLALPGPLRDEVASLIEKIQLEAGTSLLALWLHGSAAQMAMKSTSDLDFLVVLRKPKEIEMNGTRSIQITCLTDKGFRERYRSGDNFVRTVLAYGLLLTDRQFAQEFYAKPFPAADLRAHQGQESLLEEARSKLFFFIRAEDPDNARAALSSLAVATSRTILEQLGELPSGKEDLVESVRGHFGPEIAALVQTCLARESPEDELFGLQARLSTWQSNFSVYAAHLKRLLAGLSGPPQQFEQACEELLRPFYLGIQKPLLDGKVDFWCETPDGPMGVECKTLLGKYGPQHLRQAQKQAGIKASRLLLIINHQREVPLLSRFALSPAVKAEAEHLGITLRDSRDLWREHNRALITGHVA